MLSNFKYKHFHSHLRNAVMVLKAYDGSIPFGHFLKLFFSQHKKFGSKDRKQIAHLCYAFFRLGKSYPSFSFEQKILKGFQLTTHELGEEWEDSFSEFNLPKNLPDNIFPFRNHLSESIDWPAFEQAHLIQPNLFLRIRKGMNKVVKNKLDASGISYSISGQTVVLPNGSAIQDIIQLNKEAVIQDLSSQKVTTLFELLNTKYFKEKNKITVWDCCAASGGKSILIMDIFENVQLTVSDIRSSIMSNLKKRFLEAGIKYFDFFIGDAAKMNLQKKFDLVVADVPCTGSGTWSRTPETLVYFKEEKIHDYVVLQRNILDNAVNHILPNGFLLYITCSVFKEENESQVNYLLHKNFEVIEQLVLKGYNDKADTMFACLLRNKES